MKFAQLTDVHDHAVFINPMLVTRLYQIDGHMTTIVFGHEDSISVKEDVQQVLRALQQVR